MALRANSNLKKYNKKLVFQCDGLKNINSQLVNIKYDLTKTMEDIVIDSLSKIKDAIIEGLREENLKLQQKVESLKSRISKLETDCNKQDQYNRRNNLEIHRILSNISDNMLEEKVIQIFEGIDLSLTANDIEDCHHLGKSGKNTIVRFVNRKILMLSNRNELKHFFKKQNNFFFFSKSWILFAYMMKHSTNTAQGALFFFLCMFIAVTIYIKKFLWFASTFVLLGPFHFVSFSYTKMRLIILYASCFSNREQPTSQKVISYHKCP